jgi:hypothetical protein
VKAFTEWKAELSVNSALLGRKRNEALAYSAVFATARELS